MASSEIELRLEQALNYIKSTPDANWSQVAREFNVSRHRLIRRSKGIGPRTGIPSSNTKLRDVDEIALCRYIDRLDLCNFGVRTEFVTEAANYILQQRSSSSSTPTTVGNSWTARFIKRHGYTKKLQKKVDSDRHASEDITRVEHYFEKLREVIQNEGIPPEDIWNMDETGFRIGIGKDQLIVTKRNRKHLFSMPQNRESATAIEAISAGGKFLPAFLILSGQLHMTNWYRQPELEDATVIAVTPTGYSNDELSLSWLRHFQKHAIATSAKRLLIVDGHGSHHTIEFIEYCEKHNIIPFGMPPHLTHLLQPLDVTVFQPLKHYHAKALDHIVREGVVNITKVEFLGIIQQVRRQAFKRSTILSAFQKTGIWPLNERLVLENMRERAAYHTPSPEPDWQPSSNFSTPLTVRQVEKVAGWIGYGWRNRHEEDFDEDELEYDIFRYIRGTQILTVDGAQSKKDLCQTKKGQEASMLRRGARHKTLKKGGTIEVAQGRRMAASKDADEFKRAKRIVAEREKKDCNALKRWYAEAAKRGRKWRLERKLGPLHVYDTERGPGYRVVRRG